jgi:hypothetical protein
MLFVLFIVSLLGALAFNNGKVMGKITLFGNRRCSDDLIDILGLREEHDTTRQIAALQKIEEDECWLDGEVPWIFSKKNETNNNTVSTKVAATLFDPLEPCSIGHLLF